MELSLSSKLDVIARSVGAAVGFVYAAGFLVVSIHLAGYGVVEAGLFRAKFMAAGTVFLVFVALPLLAAIRLRLSFEQGSPTKPSEAVPTPKAWIISGTHFLALLYASSFVLAGLTSGFFSARVVFEWRDLVVLAAFFAAVGGITCAQKFGGLGWNAALLSLLCAILLERVSAAYASHGFQTRVIWFTFVGAVLGILPRQWPDIRRLEGRAPEWLLLLCVGIASIFARVVYPRIRPEYGGGLPSPAVIQFDEMSPFSRSDRSRVWLLDETQNGYYVLLSEGANKAVFLPRKGIRAVYFGGGTGEGR